jgi:hypothetical protein
MNSLVNLKKILSEMNLIIEAKAVSKLIKEAGPLEDFPSYDFGEDGSRQTPGYRMSEGDVAIAKELMKDTEDRWVVIATSSGEKDISNIDEHLEEGGDLYNWIVNKRYPSDYKILLITSPRMGGDHTSPNWVLHDVFGHPIDRYNNISFISALNKHDSPPKIQESFIANLHDSLPKEIRNAKSVTDMLPDIYLGILSGKLKRDDALKVKELLMESLRRDFPEFHKDNEDDLSKGFDRMIDEIFNMPKKWLNDLDNGWLKVGDNRVYLTELW